MPLTLKEIQMFNEQFQRVIEASEATIIAAINQLERKIDTKLDKMNSKFDKRFDEVDKKFNEVNRRFNEIDKRFDRVDEELRTISAEQRLQKVNLTNHERRIDKLETT